MNNDYFTEYDYSVCNEVLAIDGKAGRLYATPSGEYYSITTKLGKTKDAPALDAWFLREGKKGSSYRGRLASERGSAVHDFAEKYLSADPSSPKSMQAFVDSKNQIQRDWGSIGYDMAMGLVREAEKGLTKIYCQETAIWSDAMQTAGRVDLIGEWKGVPSVVDFKTSSKPKEKKWIEDYFLQTAFYALAHNEMFGTTIDQLVVLITVESSTPQIFVESAERYLLTLSKRLAAFERLQKALV